METSSILIVEDEFVIAKDIQTSLENMGYLVCAIVRSGEEAITKAKKEKPDLVLMDIILKGAIDGIEAAMQIQSLFKIPIVYLTAFADEETLERAKITEPYGYIIKPFNDRELNTAIEIALYKSKMEKELKKSEERFKFLAENMGDIVWTLDMDFNATYVSPSIEKVLGFTPEERKQQKLEDMVTPDSMKRITAMYLEELQRDARKDADSDRSVSLEVEYYHRNGSIVWMENIVKAIRDETGAITGIYGVSRDITQRKQVEKALRESEEKFKPLAENSADVIYKIDLESEQYTYASPSVEKLLGYSAEELLSLNVKDTVTAESYAKQQEALINGLASGRKTPQIMELEAVHKDGHILPFEVHVNFIPDELGNPVEILGVARDISERKQAEEALRESEEKYRSLFENSPIGIGIADEKGNILDFNDTIIHPGGYSREDLVKMGNLSEFYYDWDIRAKILKKAQEQGYLDEEGVQFTRKDGTPYDALLSLRPIQFEGKACWQAIVQDVTERKRAEDALRESEERFRKIIDNTEAGYFFIDQDGRFRNVNDAWLRMHRYSSPDEVIGEHFSLTQVDSGLNQAQEITTKSISGESLPTGEFSRRCKDGSIGHHTFTLNPVIHGGKNIGVEGFLIDNTEKKKLEAQLQEASKMKAIATLAGGIAHDYNNLLAVIMGNLSMAREEAEPHSVMSGLLHEIEQASYKARDLTHQFLTLSHGGHPRKELGSMENLLKEITGQVQAHDGIEYTFAIQDDLWPVEYDLKQMHFAISNVIVNAVEATPRGGTIALQAENVVLENHGQNSALPLNEGKYVRISIKDEGIGIPKEHLKQIFDPYFSTKERGVQKGMGLGLTTAYAVVQKHGGHIMVNSTTGVGTTVTIYLPAAEEIEKEKSTRQKSDDITPSISGVQPTIKRILVMDDEEMLRNLAQMMLERLGYEVETVKDGVEAIETYKKHMDSGEPFDGIILDLTIKGGMGGEQAIKELIKIDPDVKAIVCSGYFNDPVLANYEEHGFRGAMAKPYQIADLESVLKKVLG